MGKERESSPPAKGKKNESKEAMDTIKSVKDLIKGDPDHIDLSPASISKTNWADAMGEQVALSSARAALNTARSAELDSERRMKDMENSIRSPIPQQPVSPMFPGFGFPQVDKTSEVLVAVKGLDVPDEKKLELIEKYLIKGGYPPAPGLLGNGKSESKGPSSDQTAVMALPAMLKSVLDFQVMNAQSQRPPPTTEPNGGGAGKDAMVLELIKIVLAQAAQTQQRPVGGVDDETKQLLKEQAEEAKLLRERLIQSQQELISTRYDSMFKDLGDRINQLGTSARAGVVTMDMLPRIIEQARTAGMNISQITPEQDAVSRQWDFKSMEHRDNIELQREQMRLQAVQAEATAAKFNAIANVVGAKLSEDRLKKASHGPGSSAAQTIYQQVVK